MRVCVHVCPCKCLCVYICIPLQLMCNSGNFWPFTFNSMQMRIEKLEMVVQILYEINFALIWNCKTELSIIKNRSQFITFMQTAAKRYPTLYFILLRQENIYHFKGRLCISQYMLYIYNTEFKCNIFWYGKGTYTKLFYDIKYNSIWNVGCDNILFQVVFGLLNEPKHQRHFLLACYYYLM